MKKIFRRDKLIRIGIILLICLPILTATFFLKKESHDEIEQLIVAEEAQHSLQEQANIATPDTSTAVENRSTTTTTIKADSLREFLVTKDTRRAEEAGAEDGYWDGLYDGIAKDETKGRYDEKSKFRTSTEQSSYSKHYQEGYEIGYSEGMTKGKK